MRADIGDRLVLHGRNGTRIGVVVDVTDEGSVVRWADSPEAHGTWEAAKSAATGAWRRGIIAGVGREASLAQEKIAREDIPREPDAEEHKVAAGE